MISLNWDGKQNLNTIYSNNAGKTLHYSKELSYGESTVDNLIVKGDNLEVLSLLLPNYREKVKCIYIDPPYNSCKLEDIMYNDNKKQEEWLSFMYSRIVMLHSMLSTDGVIFVQLDDAEMAYMKTLLDEVFGRNNYINTVSVNMKNIAGASGGGEDKRLKKNCEYILIYAKDYIYLQPFKNVYDYVEIGELLERYKRENISWKYTSVFLDEGQKHYLTSTVGGDGNEIKIFEHKNYTIKSIETVAKETGITEKEVYYKYIDKIIRTSLPQSSIRPRVMQKLNEQHYINDLVSIEYVPKTGKNKGKTYVQYYKGNSYNLVVWLSDTVEKKENGLIYKKTKKGTYWNYASSTNNLTKEGNVRFPNGKKPEALIETILNLSTKENDLVMDIFLGSGTTCAVAHKMKRRYIGIEKENHIITHVIPRLRGIIDTCTHIQAQENKSKSKSKNTSINTDIDMDMDMDIPMEDSFKNGYKFYALDNDIDRLLLIANSDNDDKNKKTSFLNKNYYPQQLPLSLSLIF